MTTRTVKLTFLLAATALLQACSTCSQFVGLSPMAGAMQPASAMTDPAAGLRIGDPPIQPIDSTDSLHWVSQARRAADLLGCTIPFQYRQEGPILLSTLVDLNTMKSDAQFGRVMSEQVGNRLARLGYPIVEMRLRDSISVQENVGELMLSRQIQELAKLHKSPLAVVGTYTETLNQTVVNLRVVRAKDGVIVTASDFAVSNDVDVLNMLGSKAGVSKEAREAAKPVQTREFRVRP